MRHAVITLVLGVFCLATSARGADAERDTRLSRSAYTLLQADPELADLNLGVRVEKGGMAVIWGMVPSKQHSIRAERLIESIRGITAIKNQCELIPTTDAFLSEVAEALKGKKKEDPPSIPPLPPVSEPTRLSAPPAEQIVETPGATKPSSQVSFAPPPPATDGMGRNVTALKPIPQDPGAIDDRVFFGKPDALMSRNNQKWGEINHRMIERIRTSEKRYEGLKMELRDGRVVITGKASDSASAWDLADRIADFVGNRPIIVRAATQR